MACLGTIDVILKQIAATVSNAAGSLDLEGLAAEMALDGTTLAYLQLTGDPLSKVNMSTGNIEGVISVKNTEFTVIGATPAPVTSILLTALDVDTIDWLSGTQVSLAFNGTPDFSDVAAGDEITIASATNAINNGTFVIDVVSDGTDVLIITNPLRVDATGDEATDSPATGEVSTTTALDVDTIAVADGVVTMVFNLTPDLSGINPGDEITVANATNEENDGTFVIVSVTDGSDTVTYENADGIAEATDSPATATIVVPSVHDVAATRDFCTCNGLCYEEPEEEQEPD